MFIIRKHNTLIKHKNSKNYFSLKRILLNCIIRTVKYNKIG